MTTITRLRVNFWAAGILLAAFFIGLCGGELRAQSTNASVTGYITDPTKAVIVGAKVIVINVDTNVRYETTTNNSGSYDVPALPPGRYRIEVEKPGFKTVVKSDLVLHVQDTAAINFEMALGSQSEIVTVQGGGLVINTTDATVSTTIDRNFAENLPLNGRSFQMLILLTPGTVLTPLASTNGGTFSVNGQRTNANDFTVDGVSATLGGFVLGNNLSLGQLSGTNPDFTMVGTTQGMVAVDALQEFKIQTSTYAPEFGRQPGGQVSLLTRSGTNDFHGTAFDYLRNDAFDANDWFNDRRGLPKGKERQNDFGGTFGGPIFKDNSFFFFSYEGLRLLQPFTHTYQVPSLRLRGEATPAYQSILNSWPIPDGPEFTVPDPVTGQPVPTGASPFTLFRSFPTNLDSYSVRIDHSFRQRFQVFGRYAYTSSDRTFPSVNNPLFEQLTTNTVTVGANINVRPHLNDELRLNYSINQSKRIYDQVTFGGARPFDTNVLYPSPTVVGRDWAAMLISVANADFGVTQPGVYGKFTQRQINLTDNLSWSEGLHQVKLGIDYRRLFPTFGQAPLQPVYFVSSEQELISGTMDFAALNALLVAHPIYTNFSVYAQDTWRASSRLSVTYGLRWELNPPPGERSGIQPLNVIGLSNPTSATLAPLNSKLYKTTYNNFAPRLGVAYQIRQTPGRETVFRAGLGLFYDLNSETTALGFNSLPFQNNSFPSSTSFPLAAGAFTVPPIPAPLTPPYNTISAIDPNLKLPYTLQWNASLEQGLGQNQSLIVSYVAGAGFRLLRSDYLFNFNTNFLDVDVTRNASSSNYHSLQLQFNRRLSRGLQAIASYTYSHSIDNASDGQIVQSPDPTGMQFVNPNIDRGNSDFDLRHALRGAVTYNIPAWNKNLASRAILGGWSVDSIALAQSGLPVNLLGRRYRVNVSGNRYTFRLRPNIVPGVPLYLYGAQCAAANGGVPCPGGRAFNFTPGAVVGGCPDGSQSVGPFCPVPTDANGNPTQTEGDLGRNVMRGFGAWQLDFAIHRQFKLTDRVNLQFRSELFNMFNHPNFGLIDNLVNDAGTFGLAGSTLAGGSSGLNSLYQIGGPRSIQLALKLLF